MVVVLVILVGDKNGDASLHRTPRAHHRRSARRRMWGLRRGGGGGWRCGLRVAPFGCLGGPLVGGVAGEGGMRLDWQEA